MDRNQWALYCHNQCSATLRVPVEDPFPEEVEPSVDAPVLPVVSHENQSPMCSFCSDEGSCLFCTDCTSETSSPLGDPAQSFLESNSLFDKRAKKAGRRVSSWARESFRRSLLLPVSMRASHNGAFSHLAAGRANSAHIRVR